LVNVISGCLFPFLLHGSICPNNCPGVSSLNVLWDFYIVGKDSHAAPFPAMNICRHHPHFYHLCTSVIVQCQRMRVALVKKRALTRKAGQRLQLEMAHNCVAAIPPCLFVRHVYYFAGCCTSNLASYPLPFLFSAVISVRHRKQGGFRSSRLSAPSSFSFFLFSFFFFFFVQPFLLAYLRVTARSVPI